MEGPKYEDTMKAAQTMLVLEVYELGQGDHYENLWIVLTTLGVKEIEGCR